MTQLYSNNAIARITVPLYTGGMVIQIDPARAPLFPNPQRIEEYFLITLDDINDPDVYEIVKISSRSGSTLNVAARGYEGTTERSWTVADTICDHRITAGTLDSFLPCTRVNYMVVNQGSFRVIDQLNITTNNVMVKWQVTVINYVDNKAQSFEVHAIVKPSPVTVSWNRFGLIGDKMPGLVVTVEYSASQLKLKVTNNEAHDVTINATRIQHL
jgi:hypothetical protein